MFVRIYGMKNFSLYVETSRTNPQLDTQGWVSVEAKNLRAAVASVTKKEIGRTSRAVNVKSASGKIRNLP